MSTHTLAQDARSTTILNLGTLAAATFVASTAQDLGAAIPLDTTIEVEFNPNGTTTGNKQMIVYAQISLDNTNFSTGPTSGTTVTEIADLYRLGVVPANDTNTHRKMFSLKSLPKARYYKIICFNDMGVALTSGNIYQAGIDGTTT